MRPIEFRGKRIDNGEWVYGNLVIGDDATYIVYKAFGDDYKYAFKNVFIEVNPSTVGQFTGLTDKNGKKIFEGDVWNDDKVSGVVIYYECKYKIKWNDNGSIGDLYTNVTTTKYGKIIGNIHDNPELLNQQQ